MHIRKFHNGISNKSAANVSWSGNYYCVNNSSFRTSILLIETRVEKTRKTRYAVLLSENRYSIFSEKYSDAEWKTSRDIKGFQGNTVCKIVFSERYLFDIK